MLAFMKSLFLVIIMCLVSGVAFAVDEAPEASSVFNYLTIALTALFAISEALSAIPALKANGVFQFIYNALKALTKKEETIYKE